MGLETIAAATGIFAATTGIPQYFEQKKAGRRAAREQEKANDISRASAQVENARRRRQAIAQARMAQAQNMAMQGQQVEASSSLTGVQSSLSTQLGANIGAQQQSIGNQQAIINRQQNAADALRRGQERTALWDVGAQIGNTIMSFGMNAAGGPAGRGAQPNMQGQQTPLYNNPAYIRNF